MTKILGLTMVLAAFSTGVMAQNTATEPATATAVIVEPITITNAGDLHFGDIVATSAGGTVVLAPDLSETLSGVYRPSAIVNNPTVATFDVTGAANASFAITLPGAVTIANSAGDVMTVNGFTSSDPVGGTLLDNAGEKTFTVGATLNVSAAQPSGTYINTNSGGTAFTVTVTYN